jgi:hypothetical protein
MASAWHWSPVTRDSQARSARPSGLALSEFPDERFEPVEGGEGRFESVLLAGLLLAAVVGWIIAGRRIEAPWIFGDELTYSEYAKSFADSGEFLFREQPGEFVSIYPALISPAWLADSVTTAYSIAKAINVVLMASAVIPLYLWARRIVSPGYALLPALLVLVMPSFVYTGNLMTESAFLPAFVLAGFTAALAMERPTPLRQLLAVAATVLAALIRLQGFILVAVIPTAVVLKVLFDVRAAGRPLRLRSIANELRPFLPAAVLSGVAVVVYAVVSLASDRPFTRVLGAYRDVPDADYSASEVLRWTVTHLGELSLAVGMVPVSALVVLLALAWQRAATFTAAERAFLAFAAAAAPWVVAHVAAFASEFSLRVEERNMFYLAPLLFLALALWLARGLPRPGTATAIAVLLPTALLVALPLESLFNVSLRTDTFGLIPLLRVSDVLDGGIHAARIVLVAGALAAGLLFAAFPRSLMKPVIPAAVAVFLLLSAYSVSGSAKTQSHAKRFAYLLEPDPNWIDDRLGADGNAALLFTPSLNADPDVALQQEFWNRSVRDVYNFEAPAYIFPGVDVAADTRTGLFATATGAQPRPPFAVADTTSVRLAGTLVAQSGRVGLFRLEGPLRLAAKWEGIEADGWIGTDATYAQYWNEADAPGVLAIELSREGAPTRVPRTDVRVEIAALVGDRSGATRVSESATIRSGQVRTLRLQTPRPPFRLRVHSERTFSPADYGSEDTRQLGVRVSLRFRPRA